MTHTFDWDPLQQELRLWRDQGLTLPLWWRDDDAISQTPALDQLTALSTRLGLPVHLAIIPSLADDSLTEAIATAPSLIPVVHGWAHRNHAPAGTKKAEFGAHRPLDAMRAECAEGLRRLDGKFGTVARLFVPPWNRITPDLFPVLAQLGYGALSTFTPRTSPLAAPGLAQINTHLDPIDWRGTRSLAEPQNLIAQVVQQLADRRTGQADASEPYGILTHHLVHDPAIWSFTENLLHHLLTGPVTLWTADQLAAPDQQQGHMT